MKHVYALVAQLSGRFRAGRTMRNISSFCYTFPSQGMLTSVMAVGLRGASLPQDHARLRNIAKDSCVITMPAVDRILRANSAIRPCSEIANGIEHPPREDGPTNRKARFPARADSQHPCCFRCAGLRRNGRGAKTGHPHLQRFHPSWVNSSAVSVALPLYRS